jgi:hypothetical protein
MPNEGSARPGRNDEVNTTPFELGVYTFSNTPQGGSTAQATACATSVPHFVGSRRVHGLDDVSQRTVAVHHINRGLCPADVFDRHWR